MRRSCLSVAGTILTFTLLFSATSRAAQRELVFSPPDGAVSALPGLTGFAHNWKVGCALVASLNSTKVVSFSVVEARVIDDVDLSAEFGVRDGRDGIADFFLAAHQETGLVIVFGRTNAGAQKVVALRVDQDGALERRWVSVFPVSTLTLPGSLELTFDSNGSLIFFSFYDPNGPFASGTTERPAIPVPFIPRRGWPLTDPPTWRSGIEPPVALPSRHLAMIRASDGAVLDSLSLPSDGASASLLYHEERKRLLALAGGSLFVIDAAAGGLDVEATISPFRPASTPQAHGLDATGRFLIGAGDFFPFGNGYVSYDLDLKTTSGLDVPGDLFTLPELVTYHKQTGSLFVPMVFRVIMGRPGEFELEIGGLREVDIVNLNPDGSIVLSKQFEIPRRNGSGRRQALTLQATAQVSDSGLIGLVASDNGLLSFDARDGEIVGEEELDLTPVASIRLIQPRNLLLVARGDNTLLLRDFTPSPRIDSVRISKKSTAIKGSLFLSGAHVFLNGQDLGVANRNPDNPGSEIVLARRKKDFPKGQDFTVTVVNRDGLASPAFTFRR